MREKEKLPGGVERKQKKGSTPSRISGGGREFRLYDQKTIGEKGGKKTPCQP